MTCLQDMVELKVTMEFLSVLSAEKLLSQINTRKQIEGDSLAYLDMVEQAGKEEERRERERALIEEGR